MRSALISLTLLAVAASPAMAQQISQSPLLGHKAGAACTHGPYPWPSGADNVSGYGMAGCLPKGAGTASGQPREPLGSRHTGTP